MTGGNGCEGLRMTVLLHQMRGVLKTSIHDVPYSGFLKCGRQKDRVEHYPQDHTSYNLDLDNVQ